MIEVLPNLYVGDIGDCNTNNNPSWTIIHACKDPCHRRIVKYTNNLPQSHPHYLFHKKDNHLALNMVDMKTELLARFTNPIMQEAMLFIEKNINEHKILIHCNQGLSRSPSIALLYMARKGVINNQSYKEATADFKIRYNGYNPGEGIESYLIKNWRFLLKM
jgi:predicted protein tyrosine phosphatase